MSLQPLGMASRASGACLGASTASFRCSVSFGVSVVLLTHPPRPLAHSLTRPLTHSLTRSLNVSRRVSVRIPPAHASLPCLPR